MPFTTISGAVVSSLMEERVLATLARVVGSLLRDSAVESSPSVKGNVGVEWQTKVKGGAKGEA